jgi:hypothetical protein
MAIAMLLFFVAFFVLGQAKSNWFLPAFVLLLPSAAASEKRLRGHGVSLALSLLLVLGWTLPAVPGVWSALVARLPAAANASYERHLGERERDVSPTRSWASRVEEYHRSSAVDDAQRVLAGIDGPIVSNDYGLAFQVAHRLGRDRLVRLPWDPVFAGTCRRELRRGADVGFVSATWERAPAAWASGFRAAVPQGTAAGDPGVHVVEYLDWRGVEPHDAPATPEVP